MNHRTDDRFTISALADFTGLTRGRMLGMITDHANRRARPSSAAIGASMRRRYDPNP